MTPEQKQLVKNTWKQVTPIADTAADIFYRRLFEIDPSTRKLFRATDMVAQRKKLLQTLSFAIKGWTTSAHWRRRWKISAAGTPATESPMRIMIPWALRCYGRWNRVSVGHGRRRRRRPGPKSTACCPASCAKLRGRPILPR
jgi:Globin